MMYILSVLRIVIEVLLGNGCVKIHYSSVEEEVKIEQIILLGERKVKR